LLENHFEIITNNTVLNLLHNEEFYSKCRQIASILKSVKKLTNILKGQNANLAKCFVEIDDNYIEQTLTDNLNISQIVNLTLPEFLSTNNNLFESAINRLFSHERAQNLGNTEYDLIRLAQQMTNEENNEVNNL
ncbi:9658_t:CDS:2, partial [Cetraspora pellucida]